MPRPEAPPARAHWLVTQLGGHLSSALGIRLDVEAGDAELVRWLIASALHTPRTDEARVAAAYRALADAGLASMALADEPLEALAARLAGANHPRPEPTAALLTRMIGGLRTRGGSLREEIASADGLEALGARLASLAPGFGRAAVVRTLQPLRDAWPACADLPLDPAALAAALHLDLVPEGTEPDFAVESLRRTAGTGAEGPALADLEAALARLGRRACQRGRLAACPLEGDCPLA